MKSLFVFSRLTIFLFTIVFHQFNGIGNLVAQNKTADDYKPLVIRLDDEGERYVRFVIWNQSWITTNNLNDKTGLKFQPSIRRFRFLLFSQVSDRFLILGHWGLDGLNAANLDPLGNRSDAPQLFLHGAWVQYKLLDQIHIGGGLHYWRGLNRLSNSSSVNFMTLDQSRPFLGWHSLGYSDQFGRHMGVFAKGRIGNFDYRMAFNDPINNGFNCDLIAADLKENEAIYNANNIYNETRGGFINEAYFRYNFLDKESIQLPYAAGTHLGKYKILHVGLGYFYQPNGSISLKSQTAPIISQSTDPGYINELDEKTRLHHVFHYSFDAYLDIPFYNGVLNAYVSYMNFDFGPNYMGNTGGWSATGKAMYGHLGYLIPYSKLMPYIAYQLRNYDNFSDAVREKGQSLDIGLNYFIQGHHAKLTLEYHQINYGGNQNSRIANDLKQIRMQAQIFL